MKRRKGLTGVLGAGGAERRWGGGGRQKGMYKLGTRGNDSPRGPTFDGKAKVDASETR